jgi:hypothetical protein
MIDFNDAGPQFSLEQMEAPLALQMEALIDQWLADLSQFYERDEHYDPRDFKKDFLKMCAEEFDRQLQWGPACRMGRRR